jgi:PAS domain-containing protein
MLGYPDRETLLKVNSAYLYANTEDRQRWLNLIESNDLVRNFEVQVRRLDGTIIFARISARTVRDEAGNVLYLEGAIT